MYIYVKLNIYMKLNTYMKHVYIYIHTVYTCCSIHDINPKLYIIYIYITIYTCLSKEV